MLGAGEVPTSSGDYVKHTATLQKYVGERLCKAMIRYPVDAQRAFDKYAGAAIIHHERNLAHARDLHAYGVRLKDVRLQSENGTGTKAGQNKMADMYQAVQDGVRRLEAEEKQLYMRKRKAKNTGLLAKALQPSWQARTTSAFQAAVQQHDPPDKYAHRSEEAVFWINMHRLAIGDAAFKAEGFMSLAGDVVQHY